MIIREDKFLHLFSLIIVLLIIAPIVLDARIQAIPEVFIKLNFAPSTIESKAGTYKIGYLSLVNSNNIPIIAHSDIEIKLTSSNSDIASVPPSVNIPKDHDYAKFDVTVGNLSGEVQVTAIFEDQIITQSLLVGEVIGKIPDDAALKISLPTNVMNVNSEMPLSVFFERNGTAL